MAAPLSDAEAAALRARVVALRQATATTGTPTTVRAVLETLQREEAFSQVATLGRVKKLWTTLNKEEAEAEQAAQQAARTPLAPLSALKKVRRSERALPACRLRKRAVTRRSVKPGRVAHTLALTRPFRAVAERQERS